MTAACSPLVASPICCQPPLSDDEWAERSERIRSAIAARKATHPRHCGQCGSAEIRPNFDADMLLWRCSGCRRTFCERS